jgi:hypothetical protein
MQTVKREQPEEAAQLRNQQKGDRQMDAVQDSEPAQDRLDSGKPKKKPLEDIIPGEKRVRVGIGILAAVLLVIGFIVNEPNAAPLSLQVNHQTVAGTTPIKGQEQVNLKAQDFTVDGLDSGGTARMLLWNLKSEKGDVVTVLVDGKPIHDAIELGTSPVALSVPVPSVVTIRGDTSPFGTIPYGVKFPNNKMVIYNVVSSGSMNQYTLVPHP